MIDAQVSVVRGHGDRALRAVAGRDADWKREPRAVLLGGAEFGDWRWGDCSAMAAFWMAQRVGQWQRCWGRMRIFARRAASVEGAHVGNFVETKKVTVGKGSKANHLNYLGDAVIGAGVNIGAGAITCNYDGVTKQLTTIWDGAFVGSVSTLVAPVTVGEGAYVAAGSCIARMTFLRATCISGTGEAGR